MSNTTSQPNPKTLFIIHDLQIFQGSYWQYSNYDCSYIKFWKGLESKVIYDYTNISQANFFEKLEYAQAKLKKDVAKKTHNYKKAFEKKMKTLSDIDYNPVICK